MAGAIHTLVIEDTPFDPPIGVAGDLVIAVRSPRSPNSVTIMIGPNVADFTPLVDDTPPGLEVRGVLVLTPTDETVTGLIQVGDAASKYFTMGGVDYRITLQDIGSITKADQPWPTYHFLIQEIQEEEPGSAPQRAAARTAVLDDHSVAAQSNDFSAVRRTASVFGDSVLAELSPSLNDRRLAAVVLYNGAVACRQLNDPEGERAMCSRVIEELEDIPDGVVQEHVAKALYARAYSYRDDRANYSQVIEDSTQIDRRYVNVPHVGAMMLVAQSLVMRAYALRALERFVESREAAQTVIDRYSSHEEHSLIKLVEEARMLLRLIAAPDQHVDG